MRFLVDENLPADVVQVLRNAGHDAVHVRDVTNAGASDEEVWQLAAIESRLLVTRDLDFPLPLSPAPPGLVLLRLPDAFTRQQIADVMSDFIAADAFAEVADSITVVSPGRIRVRKL